MASGSRLSAIVSQAWDLRGTPYVLDACAAIEDEWHRLGMVWRHEENLWLESLERLEGASPIRTAGESSATEPVGGAGLSVAAQPSPSTHLWWTA